MKNIFLIPISLLSLTVWGESSLLAFKDKFPVQLKEYKITNLSSFDNTEFINDFYLRIHNSEPFDVYPLADGFISGVQNHPIFSTLNKVAVNHEGDITSYYIVGNIEPLQIGEPVTEKRKLGTSLTRSFMRNNHYADYAIQKRDNFILPELLKLVMHSSDDNYDDLIIELSTDIINNSYPLNLTKYFNFHFYDKAYNVHTEKSTLIDEFERTIDIHEVPLHRFEYEIFRSDKIKIVYLVDSDYIVEIQVTHPEVVLNNVLRIGVSLQDVISDLGNPNSIQMNIQFTPIIMNNILYIDQKCEVIDYSITGIQYPFDKDSIHGYYLDIKFTNDKVSELRIVGYVP